MILVQPVSSISVPPSVWAFGGGFALWIIIFLLLPRPMWTYVLAHELTHALWALLRGASVRNISIKRDTGSVTVSKSDFLITLAPYFFPLYTVVVIAVYYLLSMFVAVEPYELFWLGLVGFTWGFHFSFTITTLLQSQSDIRECGRLFSYAVIYLFNVLGIALWIVMVSTITVGDLGHAVLDRGVHVVGQIRDFVQ